MRRHLRLWPLVALYVGMGWSASADDHRTLRTDPEYLIDTWENEDGLPENSATAMVQRPDGYLWFGTFNGLVRFDGVRFKVLNPANTPALPDPGIVNLHSDRSGRLWVSTLRGLVALEDGRWRSFGTNEGWAGNYVRTFAERANGDLLLTTFDGRVLTFENGRLGELPAPPGEPGKGYFGAVDETGQWWVTQSRFVGYWDRQRWVQPAVPDWSAVGEGLPCLSARNGGVWVVFGKNLLRFRQGSMVSQLPLPQLTGGVWSLAEDSRSNLWICSYDSGLFRLDPSGSLRRWSTTNGLSTLGCRFAFEDREQNIWVGTSGGGLNRFKSRRFRDVDRESLSRARIVRSVAPAREGGVWVASFDQGLFRHSSTGASHVAVPGPRKGSSYGLSVLEDRAGRLWYGDLDACWLRRGPTGFEKVPLPWAKNVNVSALFEDSRTRMWTAVDQGVLVCEDGQVREVGTAAGLPSGGVSGFGEDAAGVPWLAAREGVFRYGNQRFSEVRTADDQPIPDVLSFLAETDGTMWMGTRAHGLLRLRDRQLKVIGLPAGLPTPAIHAMIVDDLDFFWMPSETGILRAARKDLHAVADGAKVQLDCQLLDQRDGLPSASCPVGQPICARDSSGRLWFATQRGVAMIDPAAFRRNPLPPPVHIEELAYHVSEGKPRNGTSGPARTRAATEGHLREPFQERLSLPPGTHRLEIRYTALSYDAPEKVRFQVRLEGRDAEWDEVAGRRTAQYDDLPPGSYVFHVRAANGDGVWNETGTSLAFTVMPYLWQTRWFRVLGVSLAAALLGAVIYGGMRHRVLRSEQEKLARQLFTRQLIHSQEQERKRVAAELHDGLGQDLLLIKNRLALAVSRRANAAESNQQIDAAVSATNHAINEVRSISHALRPSALDQVGLTKAIEGMVEQLGEGTRLKLSADLDPIDGLLPPEMEMNLFRIIQEGLNNILRHANAALVILEVKREEPELRVSLYDDGRGFDAGRLLGAGGLREGLGLTSMSERAQYIGGRLDIQSAPGRGTRVTVRIRLPHPKA